tara:strand:- start:224 stop:574 length:351 start_codon:yes stop_codon:yes gene_type:complete
MANTFTSFYNADVSNTAELTFTGDSAKESIISSLKVANIDGTNDAEFTCTITDNDASAYTGTSGTLKAYIAKTVTIPADTTVDFGKIFLESNDKLWTLAGAAGDISVYGSVLQIDN